MQRIIIAVGGGELKTKETLKIDGYIAGLIKKRAGEKRGYALFLPTASHDSMPYFNSFRKIYTSEFDIKADVALTCYREMDYKKIEEKFLQADMVYAGGGDTLFMLKKWQEWGIDILLREAYERGVIICGLSAGAVCWFERMYTDSAQSGEDNYNLAEGLGWIKGVICPHYNRRREDFDAVFLQNFEEALALEDNSAAVFENGKAERYLTSGGSAYLLTKEDGEIKSKVLISP